MFCQVVGIRALEMMEDKAVIDIDMRWAGNAEFVVEAGVKPVPLLVTLNKICFSGRMRVELAPLVPVVSLAVAPVAVTVHYLIGIGNLILVGTRACMTVLILVRVFFFLFGLRYNSSTTNILYMGWVRSGCVHEFSKYELLFFFSVPRNQEKKKKWKKRNSHFVFVDGVLCLVSWVALLS